MDDTTSDAQINVTVEMADDFRPGARTAAALADLVAALHDEHGDETSGFAFADQPLEVRSFTYRVTTKSSFYEGWPSKWKVSGFDGKGNDQARFD